MSGHSKWKTNKGKKAVADAKKGAAYTKVIKEITIAAREGGGSIETNPKLRTVIARAREINMPQDNVKQAILRGTGELPGVMYETVRYEGFAPGGVAILIEAITDNKNRTAAEIRNIVSKKNGNLGGSVAWMFSMKGHITVDKSAAKEEELMNIALEAGAEDLKTDGKSFEIFTTPQDFEKVKAAIQGKNIKMEEAEVTMIPSSTVKPSIGDAKQIMALLDALDEHDDVQNVYDNADIPDEMMEQIMASQ
jgi:YebC/PmpR family DNA-binding regulatory protein